MAANVKNLPLSVIFAAKSGDGQALGAVLNHYQRYIRIPRREHVSLSVLPALVIIP